MHDSSNDVTNRWGVTSGFPVTFVINRAGAVQKMFVTQVTGEMLQARDAAAAWERPGMRRAGLPDS